MSLQAHLKSNKVPTLLVEADSDNFSEADDRYFPFFIHKSILQFQLDTALAFDGDNRCGVPGRFGPYFLRFILWFKVSGGLAFTDFKWCRSIQSIVGTMLVIPIANDRDSFLHLIHTQRGECFLEIAVFDGSNESFNHGKTA